MRVRTPDVLLELDFFGQLSNSRLKFSEMTSLQSDEKKENSPRIEQYKRACDYRRRLNDTEAYINLIKYMSPAVRKKVEYAV